MKKCDNHLYKHRIADISFLNLETPLCYNTKKIQKTGPCLKASPECAEAIKTAGFGVVGLANNHILDWSEDGLRQTLHACAEHSLKTCGAGKNLAAAQLPLIIEKKGIKIAFIAVSEREFNIAGPSSFGAAPLDLIDNVKQIEAAQKAAHMVFITIHGGNEYFPYPRPGLRKICKFFIERGVDGVVCHHPHVPGAYELYQGKPIIYSLGNLIFDKLGSRFKDGWDEGYALGLDYELGHQVRLRSYKIIPYRQSIARGGIVKLKNIEERDFIAKIENFRSVLLNEAEYESVWQNYCKSKESDILMQQYLPFTFPGLYRLCRSLNMLKVLMVNKTTCSTKLNIVRCDSHLELLQSVLKRNFDKISGSL